MKKRTAFLYALVFISLLLSGCRHEGAEPLTQQGNKISDIEQIHQLFNNFIKAHQTQDINLIKEIHWKESSFYHQNIANAKLHFARYSEIDIEFSEINIEFYAEGERAGGTLKKKFQAKERDTNIEKYIEDSGIVELIKAESRWVIVSWHWRTPMKRVPEVP
jgi:hypothetical protein